MPLIQAFHTNTIPAVFVLTASDPAVLVEPEDLEVADGAGTDSDSPDPAIFVLSGTYAAGPYGVHAGAGLRLSLRL